MKRIKQMVSSLLVIIVLISCIPISATPISSTERTLPIADDIALVYTATDDGSSQEIGTVTDKTTNKTLPLYLASLPSGASLTGTNEADLDFVVFLEMYGGKGTEGDTEPQMYSPKVASFENNNPIYLSLLPTEKYLEGTDFVDAPAGSLYYKIKQAYELAYTTLPTSEVKGCFCRVTKDVDVAFFLFIQISTATGGNNNLVYTSALQSLIASVTDETAENYYPTYDSNDRYNGKENDTLTGNGSLWAAFTAADGPLAHAQNVLANSSSQNEIDAEVTALTAAIAKLIPKSQLNATYLYETLNKYNYGESTLATRTDVTAENYRTKRKLAQDYFDTLFTNEVANDGEGQNNRAENQGYADSLALDLENAAKNLMPKSLVSEAQRFQAAIGALDTVFGNLNENNYESTSWQTFSEARSAALSLLSEHPAGENLTRPEYNTYRTALKNYWKAAYGLKSKTSPTVTLVFSDDFGMRHPAYALGVYYKDDLTMTAGTHTLKELLVQAGLTGLNGFATSTSYDTDKLFWDTWLVYINGILVRDPLDDYETGGMAILLADYYGSDDISWNDVCVRNGDVVTLVRTEVPMQNASAGVGYEGVSMEQAATWFGCLSLNLSKTTFKEGETVTATITRQNSELPNYTANDVPYPYATLVVYGPQNADGTWPKTPVLMDGGDSLTLYQAGQYLVTVIDTRAQDTTKKSYPHLRGGCTPILVTVEFPSAEELQRTRAQYLNELEAVYAAYSAEDYTKPNWDTLTAAYTTASDAITNATATASMKSALETARLSMAEVEAIDHKGILARFAHYLKYLPSIQQIENGCFTKADIQRMGWIISYYSSMSAYQKDMLSPAQQEQYNALVLGYGSDGSGLPEFTPFTVTMSVDEAGLIAPNVSTMLRAVYYDRDARQQFIGGASELGFARSYVEAGNTPTITVSSSTIKADAIELIVNISKEYYDHFDGIEIENAEVDSISVLDLPTYITYTYYILTPYHDFTIHIKSLQDSLQKTKNEALTALQTALLGYSKSDYTSENWSTLTAAYSKGVADINTAENKTAVDSAKETAIAAMAAVPKKTANSQGTVTVIVENSTYQEAAFKDIIVRETVELNGDSTMMRCVLEALAKNGYSWAGTGGSGYGISYLSYIYEDTNKNHSWDAGEPKLGEFSAGPQSGWMGTLNDWFVNEGFNTFNVTNGKLQDGDVIHVQFTTTGYGTDLGATWANNDTSLAALDVEGGSIAPTFVDTGVLEYVLTPEGGSVSLLPTAANKNFQVRIFLNQQNKSANAEYYRRGESIPVKSGDVVWIGVGEKAWESMNDGSITGTWYKLNVVSSDDANAVVKLINAIGNVTYSNYESKQNAVDLARAAYDALTSAAKSGVTNLDTLTAAEAAIAGYQKVGTLKAEIAALPKHTTDADRTAVNTVKSHYASLTPAQQNLLTVAETNKLLKAVNTLAVIDALAAIDDTKDFDHTAANSISDVETALAREINNSAATVKATAFTAASNATGNGSYTATVTVTMGSGSTLASQSKEITGSINYVKSNDASVQSIKVSGVTATGSGTTYSATLPYGTVLAQVKAADFAIAAAENAACSAPTTTDSGVTWTFTVTAEDGTTTETYTVTLSVSTVSVTEKDSWVYAIGKDAAIITVTNLTQAVSTDGLGLPDGTETVNFWLELTETASGSNTYTVKPIFSLDGAPGQEIPAAALIGEIGVTLPISGTAYSRVLYNGTYLEATGNAGGITFTVSSAGDYTLIPDAHIAAVTFHLNGSTVSGLTDGELRVYYLEDDGATLPTPEQLGYTFKGWHSENNVSSTAYTAVSTSLPDDLYAIWQSQNVNATVTVGGVAATRSGTVYTATLPYGSAYPKAAEIVITLEDTAATKTNPLTGDDGMSWSFTVTAEDGTKKEYTLQVVIAEQTAEDILAAAKQTLADQSWDTDQRTANDAASLKTFVEGKLKGLDLGGAAYTVTIDSVAAAKAGDEQNTKGTAGSYRFTVTLSSGGKSDTVAGSGSISASVYVAPAQLADYEKALKAVQAYLKANVTNPDVGSTEGEWVVFALNRGGVADNAWNEIYLENLKKYLDETDGILAEKNYTEYSRVILALTSMGVDASGITTEKGTYDLVAHLLDKQSNGDYWAEWQGNNGTAFALLAMDSHDYLNTAEGKAARAALIASLKANQQESGAWAIEGKGTPDLDVTAAAVYALAPYYLDSSKLTALGGSVSAAEVKAMVENALAYLSDRQNADGGFGSVEADVWAIIALSSLGRDADTDPAFVKNGKSLLADMLSYRNESTGAFRHLASGSDNQMGTEQAAYGLVAYDRFKKNQNTLYDMSDVEFATAEEKADQAAAEAVEERIDAIGEVTLESKAKIDAARAAYNALTDEQKALVSNLAVLEAAEKKYKELTESASQEDVDQAAAKGVDDLIDAIGEVSLTSESDIQAARAAYDALTDEQEAQVTKLDALKAAEAKLAALKADKAAAKTVDDLIRAIGEVTKESEAAIQAARAAYNSLTDAQKQQVTRLPELIEAEWKLELLKGDSQEDDGKLHVTMRLIGAELAAKDVDLGKEAYLPNYVTWIPTTQYAMDEGTTVYDLWVLATWQYGIRSVGADKNYVATVYSPFGYELSEFTNGRRSGWMYTINGRHPGFGLKEQPLHDGDMIVWHYVNDYSYEVADWISEGAWQALGDGTYYNRWLLAPDYFGGWGGGINAGTDSDPGSGSESGSGVNPNQVSNVVTLKADMEATGAYAILDEATTWNWLQNTTDQSVMPIRVDSGIADRIVIQLEAIPVIGLAMRDTEVRLDTPKGTVILDPQTMDTLAENGNDVRVIIEANRNGTTTIRVNSGSRPADVDVKIELQAPYNGQVLVMVNQDGTEEVIKKSYVENGKVYAVIPAGATVKVADNGKTFGDVKVRDWYADAVEFVSSHELFQGVGENKFDPQASMTRAMLVTVLYRLENEPESSGKVKFADVAEDTWYADAVAWAAETKLVNGTDKGFEPNADITREQIATILYRYAQSLGMDTKARGIVSRFGDSAEISGWAADAMAWAVEVGLFRGDENENLNPQGNATRAEVATLLERLVKLIVK